MSPGEMVKKAEVEEDMSDLVFEKRHEKAEEEEQNLWEKWTIIREEEGKTGGGRSKSSGWRDVQLVDSPRKRTSRITSAQSTASSTPGRMSPVTMSKVQNICVEPVIVTKCSKQPRRTPSKRSKIVTSKQPQMVTLKKPKLTSEKIQKTKLKQTRNTTLKQKVKVRNSSPSSNSCSLCDFIAGSKEYGR